MLFRGKVVGYHSHHQDSRAHRENVIRDIESKSHVLPLPQEIASHGKNRIVRVEDEAGRNLPWSFTPTTNAEFKKPFTI